MSRFRLYPTAEQEAALSEHCAHARFVWNLALEQKREWRRGRGPVPGLAAQSVQLTEARAESEWLGSGSVTVQQQALRDLDRAFASFFKGTHGYPGWRKAGRSEGFRVVGSMAGRVRAENGRWSSVLVPKVGWVRFRRSREVPAAKSYRVKRDRSGRWHIGFAVGLPEPVRAPGTGEVVGVDRGIAVSAALSSGELLKAPGLRPKERERLVRLQRRLGKSVKGSARRRAVVGGIARLHAKAADRRRDWAEQTSTDLARRFDVIGVEALRIEKMSRSAKGSVALPGRNVRAKAAVNRGIRENAWGLLERRLGDKAPGRVVRVDAAYTSQTCSGCGHCARGNRESQAVFRCGACGHAENADLNAAKNVRDRTAAGLAVAGRGDTGELARSVKRQPLLSLAV